MKAIILAAGVGSRMKNYTKSLPKGMMKINGKTLIERQIQVLKNVGIKKIVIVTGYKFEMITYKGVEYYHNKNYQETNMIESFMCAECEFEQDLIVTYADLIYTEDLIRKLIKSPYSVAVCVDPDWKNYWLYRYGQIETDLETLSINNGVITELGAPSSSSEGIHYRYIGVIKFSIEIIPKIVTLYRKKKELDEFWVKSDNSFINGYMTDLLYEMIANGIPVNSVKVGKQWLEIDTPTDYKNLLRDYNTGEIGEYFLGDIE